MPRIAYVALSYLLAPLVAGFLVLRGLRNPAYWDRFGERFGFTRLRVTKPSAWIHAVSVGEVQAAAPLVRRLQSQHPDLNLVVTTVTPTGAHRVQDLFGDTVAHCYAPYDLPGSVRRFFDRTRPRLAIIIETELWPNLYHECGRRNVPLVLASARISPRSVDTYRRFVSLFREALSHGIVIAAQSEEDAERFRALGANPSRTHTTGNIKFDFELPSDLVERGAELRAWHAAGRPVWVAGSTHDGEEQQLLDAHRQVCEKFPDALLVLVPRHPERFSDVVAHVRRAGFATVTRSSGERCVATDQIFVVDTLGELPMMYSAGDVAFVAGSLVPVGGHNMLEPAALGKPILTGPHTFNAEGIATLLLETGAAICVRDSDELAQRIVEWFAEPERAEQVGSRGRDALVRNRGALERLMALIDPLLDADHLIVRDANPGA